MASRVFIALRLLTVFLTLCLIIKAPNEGSGELFTWCFSLFPFETKIFVEALRDSQEEGLRGTTSELLQ